MEDIEMQLVRMHAEKPDETSNLKSLENANNNLIPFASLESDIMDAGAMDNSSDSDYEPPGNDNTDALLEAAVVAEKNQGKLYAILSFNY